MGFGSYDESEQQNQEINTDDDDDDGENVDLHQNEYEGEITFETEASTDELVDRLTEIKGDSEDE